MERPEQRRRLPVGAEVVPGEGVHFRVWAPRRKRVEVVLEGEKGKLVELRPEANGYFSGMVSEASPGSLYRYQLDGGPQPFPDPASRYQPDGPHGPSEVLDPSAFRWSDQRWRGVDKQGQVIYEMHVGTFTQEGTYAAAERELPHLADLGITILELMPVVEFAGRFGWGYDGVDLFAPFHHYGRPDDLRRFVDSAHRLGMGVILDVVYNHLGPDGNYLKQFAEHYFTDAYSTDWGEAINFDDEHSGPVREFFIANAGYWIDEFHFDGLRFDATQNIYDSSSDHILAAMARQARSAAHDRITFLVAENEPQQTKLVRPPHEGGYELDALWNDDFHHSAWVVLSRQHDAYYSDYLGNPQEFISCARWGTLFQGQRYRWQKKRRGTPTFGLPAESFVTFIQNHDQVANSAFGLRCQQVSSPGRYRAMTALFLLMPGTPMLFQGQEFGSSSPFLFFADHQPDLAKLVQRGRASFLAQFRNCALPEVKAVLAGPANPATFERCKLKLGERKTHAPIYALHRDLLQLRREDPRMRVPRRGGVDGAVLGPEAFLLRYFADDGDDRLLVVNFGRDLHLAPAPEPLLAPPEEKQWAPLWSSEDLRYGGQGTPPLETDEGWRIPGEAAVLLRPVRRTDEPSAQPLE